MANDVKHTLAFELGTENVRTKIICHGDASSWCHQFCRPCEIAGREECSCDEPVLVDYGACLPVESMHSSEPDLSVFYVGKTLSEVEPNASVSIKWNGDDYEWWVVVADVSGEVTL